MKTVEGAKSINETNEGGHKLKARSSVCQTFERHAYTSQSVFELRPVHPGVGSGHRQLLLQ